jgi:hypothetical protein
MSLEVAAKYLAAHGRGPDDQLVHMSGKEVAGLQALAKAAGGSLTINPHTGLTEAGFLDDIAPIVIGAGLAYMSGGTSLGAEMFGADTLLGGLSNSAIIGGGMGLAGMALNGGDLGAGLRYGLGGYGGASLAGMAGAGAPTPTPTEVANTTPGGAQAVTNTVAPAPVTGAPPPSSTPLSDQMYQDYGPPPASSVAPATAPAVGGPTTYDSFGNVVPAGSPAAAIADPTGLAQAQVSANAAAASNPSMFDKALALAKEHPYITAGLAAAPFLLKKPSIPTGTTNPQMIRPYTYERNPAIGPNMVASRANMIGASYVPGQDTSERQWFNPSYTALEPYRAADGGIIALAGGGMAAGGGPVELMSNQATTGANTMYPMANMRTSAFATPSQTPQAINMMANMAPSGGGTVDQMSGEPNMQGSRMASGGVTDLGSYSDGGRLLRGPGDGVSDSIPAQIGNKQPARLADGEFVVPARIVSELGNGSTEAGAKQLYKMLDRVQNARAKTTGKSKVAKNTNAAKYLPA